MKWEKQEQFADVNIDLLKKLRLKQKLATAEDFSSRLSAVRTEYIGFIEKVCRGDHGSPAFAFAALELRAVNDRPYKRILEIRHLAGL